MNHTKIKTAVLAFLPALVLLGFYVAGQNIQHTKIKTAALAFLPALILLGFYVAGQSIQHTSAEQPKQYAVVEPEAQTEAPAAVEPTPVQAQQSTPPVAPAEQAKPVVVPSTPLPPVDAVPMPKDFKRADGFDNACYQMEDGSWTTVIVKTWQPSSTMYLYEGEIDTATEAPATAVGSQQWCKDNAPQ